jgi:carboxymethylenebutenolidase
MGARVADVDPVVAYHPGTFYPQEMTRLKAAVLVHQRTADHSLPEGQIATLIENLKAHKIPTQAYWYEGADHGFLAYTRPIYKPDAAKLSWDPTIAFLRKNMGVRK